MTALTNEPHGYITTVTYDPARREARFLEVN
jgi:hypothetical protein